MNKTRFPQLALLAFLVGLGFDEHLAWGQAALDRTLSLRLLLSGGTVHVDAGQAPVRASVLIENGVIQSLGPAPANIPGTREISLEGMSVYPAWIDAGLKLVRPQAAASSEPASTGWSGSAIDLSETSIGGMQPDNHHGLSPEWRAADHLSPLLKSADSYRAAGYGLLHAIPHGQILSGRSAVYLLSGRAPRESFLRENGAHSASLNGLGDGEYPSTIMGVQAHLRQAKLDAEWMVLHNASKTAGKITDPAWEMLANWGKLGQPLLVPVGSIDQGRAALALGREFGLPVILWGGGELVDLENEIAAAGAMVLLKLDWGDEPKPEDPKEPTFEVDRKDPLRLQQHQQRTYQRRVQWPELLAQKKIPFAFSSDGLASIDLLAARLDTMRALGVRNETLLEGLTSGAARLCGVETQCGSITVGKRAAIAAWTAPFGTAGAKLRYLVVDGAVFEFNKEASQQTPQATSVNKPDLSGEWTGEIERGESKTGFLLHLEHAGDKLSGTFASEQGAGRVAATSKLDGLSLQVDVELGLGDKTLPLQFSGKLAQDELAGTVTSPFGGPAKWRATRTDDLPADALSPATLTGIEELPSPASESTLKPLVEIAANGDAEPVELPADRQQRPVAIGPLLLKGGHVLTGTGKRLPSCDVLLVDGRIRGIGEGLQPPEGTTTIDVTGQYIMPGIVDTHNHMMLQDVNEATHSIVAEVQMRDALISTDPEEYRWLAMGMTTARLLHGSANTIGGQHVVVSLNPGSHPAEKVFPNAPPGIKVALGENVKRVGNRFPRSRLGVEATLSRGFFEALDYRRRWQAFEAEKSRQPDAVLVPPRKDQRLEALVSILDQRLFMHAHCYRSDEILMLLRVASQHGLRVWSLQHALEAYKVAPEVTAHQASVSTFADLWAYKVEAYDATPENGAIMSAAGANVVIKSDFPVVPSPLNLEAAKSIRYGNVDPMRALEFITRNPARELGIEDEVGTIEVGKRADLAIFNRHPLDSFARCEWTIVNGEVRFQRMVQPSAMLGGGAGQKSAADVPRLISSQERRPAITWPENPANRWALQGARIIPIDAPPIERGTILIEDGRIVGLGTGLSAPEGYQAIVLDGLEIYPGLIDGGTTLGLTEIGQVRVTQDFSEGGKFQPDLRAGIALNPDSELFPVARAGGITTALIRPTGGLISGQASLCRPAGWTMPEMVLQFEAGLVLNWPQGSTAERGPRVREIKEFFEQARRYLVQRESQGNDPIATVIDPRFEAMIPYLRGEKPVLIEAEQRSAIIEAVQFATDEKLKLVITGGLDAWRVAKQLAERQIPVILGPVNRRPLRSYEPYDTLYAAAGRLQAAGVKFCFRSNDGPYSRNVPFEAAISVAYGLDEEAAQRAVTLSAAEILGMGKELGSISIGKRANLVIADGSPLQASTQLKGVIIDGVPQSLETRQTRLANKYRQRLMPKGAP